MFVKTVSLIDMVCQVWSTAKFTKVDCDLFENVNHNFELHIVVFFSSALLCTFHLFMLGQNEKIRQILYHGVISDKCISQLKLAQHSNSCILISHYRGFSLDLYCKVA